MTIEEDIAHRDRIREELRRLGEELRPVLDRLELAGVEEHMHGSGTYEDPGRWHAHLHDDPDHEHEPRSADDAPWPDMDIP